MYLPIDSRILTEFMVKPQLQWIARPLLDLWNCTNQYCTEWQGTQAYVFSLKHPQRMGRICQVEGQRPPLVFRPGGNAFHRWLVGLSTENHSKAGAPRPRALLCRIKPWETLFVSERSWKRGKETLTSKLGCLVCTPKRTAGWKI